MGIKPNFTIGDIRKRLDRAQMQIETRTIDLLRKLGNECVALARSEGTYTDQTGNLRSSTGYVIVANGKVVDAYFSTANTDTDDKGQKTGKAFAEGLAQNYQTGYALIVVAGMAYAAAVESKGKDVLTSAEKYAEKKLPGLMARLKKSIDKKYAS